MECQCRHAEPGSSRARESVGTTKLPDGVNGVAMAGWQAEKVPSAAILHTVAVSGPGMAWAGGIAVRDASGFATLIFRRGGQGWEQVQAPQIGRVNRLLAVSEAHVWGVGDGWSLHWDGSAWRSVPVAVIQGSEPQLFGLAQFGAGDVWAAGYAPLREARRARGTVQHWDGTAWADLPVPDVAAVWSLSGIAGTSPADLWAVGRIHQPPGEALALHWDGQGWERVPVPGAAGRSVHLADVAVLDSADVWAAGFSQAGGNIRTRQLFTAHWDGRTWSAGTVAGTPGQLTQLATDGTLLWGVGYAPPGVPLAARLEGRAWKLLPGPAGPPGAEHTSLHGATVLAGGGLLAVGASAMPNGSSQPLAAVLRAVC